MFIRLIRLFASIFLTFLIIFTFYGCNKKADSTSADQSSQKKAKVLEIPFAPDPSLAPRQPPNVSPPTYPPPTE